MLISVNWLRELTATKLSPEQLRERLTMVGLAIDAVETHADDAVLDVEVPSNRPDCLSHIGIAREVAVIEKGKMAVPAPQNISGSGKTEDLISVEIEDADLCPRYAARIVRGVKIGPSPSWLAKRLETIGQRPINNVADITNYVLHEFGQPLHAFDYSKLQGRKIIVRPARKGETLTTLDGVERVLTEEALVIADSEKAVALAGIMGGEDSEISNSTSDVLIESAYFNPDSVRKTARRLGMDTEASRRFERGADREGVIRAQQRCVELICEIAGGTATENVLDVYPKPAAAKEVAFRPERVEKLTSLKVSTDRMEETLSGLGFEELNKDEKVLNYRVPSWRVDVEQEEDLVEEVARHTGYDKIASELPASNWFGEYQASELKQRVLRRALNAFGFDEAINFSFVSLEQGIDLIPSFSANDHSQPELSNPIIEDATWMRSTLLPGLLNSVRHNLNHGIRDVRLFETGRIFTVKQSATLPEERLALGLVVTGGPLEGNRAQAERDSDFFDLKGALETAVDWMNLEPLNFAAGSVTHLRSGQTADIFLANATRIGSIGRLSESVSAQYKFRQPVFVAELDLDALLASNEKPLKYTPLPRFPAVVRDLSLLVDRNVSLNDIRNAVFAMNVADRQGVTLVGTYEGGNVPPTKRSVTLRIEYRADSRTLRDEEVEERHSQLTTALLERFAAEQR